MDARREAKRLRAQKRREAAKNPPKAHTEKILVKPGHTVADTAKKPETTKTPEELRREAKRLRAQKRREAAKNPPKADEIKVELKPKLETEVYTDAKGRIRKRNDQDAKLAREGRQERRESREQERIRRQQEAQTQAPPATGKITGWTPPKQMPGEPPADYIKRSRADKRRWQKENPNHQPNGFPKPESQARIKPTDPPHIAAMRSEAASLRTRIARTPVSSPEYRQLQNELKTKQNQLGIAEARQASAGKSPRAIVREKVKYNNPGDALDPEVNRELDAMAQIPPVLMQRLNNLGVKTYISTDPLTQQDTNQRLADVQPRGWPPGSTWREVGGAYYPIQSQVTTAVRGGGGSSSGSTMLHELGHAVGDKLGYDNDPRVKAAHKAVFDRLSPYLRQDGPGGRAGVQEFVAEAFATTVSNPSKSRMMYGDDMFNLMTELLNEHR